jgi:hypothetical protein
MTQLETPVAMIVFRRPDVTRRVFATVAAARPKQLFLIADGPRADRPEEAARCEEVREIVTAVDWPCQVETNFAERNMGLRLRVVSGLNWVFSQVEDAIILEDDCLPDPSFFPFCSELLERHRDHQQIGLIGGFNPLEENFSLSFSYYYSLPISLSIWGWATWRRAWREYDDGMQSWPAVKEAGLLNLLFPDKKVVAYWSRVFEGAYGGAGPSSWAYHWIYTCWMRNWLSIVPRRNLVRNIGFGPEATHTKGADLGYALPAGAISFPLQHPPAITAWTAYAMQAQKHFYARSIVERIRRRLILRFRSTAW